MRTFGPSLCNTCRWMADKLLMFLMIILNRLQNILRKGAIRSYVAITSSSSILLLIPTTSCFLYARSNCKSWLFRFLFFLFWFNFIDKSLIRKLRKSIIINIAHMKIFAVTRILTWPSTLLIKASLIMASWNRKH